MESADTFTRCIHRVQNRLGILAECIPCIRQADVLAGPLKELCAEDFLQRFDLEGQCRLSGGNAARLLDLKFDPKTKQPFAFSMKDDRPFALGGLWDAWRDPNGGWLQSFSIITTDPNELTATVHNRMPLIVQPKDYDRWLSREDGEQPPLDWLRPFPAEEMQAQEVSKDVGSVRNNGPELLNSA